MVGITTTLRLEAVNRPCKSHCERVHCGKLCERVWNVWNAETDSSLRTDQLRENCDCYEALEGESQGWPQEQQGLMQGMPARPPPSPWPTTHTAMRRRMLLAWTVATGNNWKWCNDITDNCFQKPRFGLFGGRARWGRPMSICSTCPTGLQSIEILADPLSASAWFPLPKAQGPMGWDRPLWLKTGSGQITSSIFAAVGERVLCLTEQSKTLLKKACLYKLAMHENWVWVSESVKHNIIKYQENCPILEYFSLNKRHLGQVWLCGL